MHSRTIVCAALSFLLAGSALAKAEESFDEKNCRKAQGQSTVLVARVAEGIGVPEKAVKYEGSFIGGPLGGCAGLFSTPKGAYECVVSPWSSDGGKSYFIGVPSAGMVAGMSNLCRKAK